MAAITSVMCRLWFGPHPQALDYHEFADTRTVGIVPHAGEVLTNLAIRGAALLGWKNRPRMVGTSDESVAPTLLVAGTGAMAFGSVYYHWSLQNETLVWDRISVNEEVCRGHRAYT